jgi:ABC-2 type transport system permease protein
MRVYVEVAKRAFRQQLAYRTANLAGLTTNAFWGALRSFLFLGLYQGRELAAGWSVRDAIDYVWATQALIMPVYFWNWREIAVTIRTGDVVSDLAKPVDYYAFWLSRDAGRAVFHTLFRWLPTVLLGAALVDYTESKVFSCGALQQALRPRDRRKGLAAGGTTSVPATASPSPAWTNFEPSGWR